MKKLSLIFFFLLIITSSLANKPDAHKKIDKRIEAIRISSFSSIGSKKYFEIAGQILRDSRQISYSEGIAKIAVGMANFYNRIGEFHKGNEYLKIAEAEEATKESEEIRADLNFAYGQMYAKEKLYDKAIESYKKILNAETVIDPYTTAMAYGDISLCFSLLKRIDSAFFYLKKSYRELLKSNLPEAKVNMAVVCNNLSRLFTKRKQNDSARFYLNVGIHVANQSKHPYALGTSKAAMAMYYHSIHKNDSAIIYLKSAAPFFKKINMIYETRTLYKMFYRVYKSMDKQKEANEYLALANALTDSLNNKKNLSVVVQSVLDQEGEVFNSEKRKLRILIGIIVGGLFLILVLGYYSFKKYKRNQNKIVKEKEDLLSSMSEINSTAEIESLGLLIELSKAKDDAFLVKFNEIYPNFKGKMLAKFPDLNQSELELCAYLRMNFDTKEIARYADISVRSVESRKYRIRKKFNISSSEDLNLFILSCL